MVFEVGNRAAVGHGRPRRLDREIERLAEAAAHARALAEQGQLAALMTDSTDMRELLERRVVAGLDALAEVEAQLAAMRELAEPVEDAEQKPGRRRRQHSPSAWEVEVAAAALALDRLIPDTEARQ